MAAEQDLERIGDHIASSSPERAIPFVGELRHGCVSLAELPLGYPLLPGHEQSGVRQRVHGNYLNFFQVTENSINVLKVLHGAMDYDPLLP
ncbi:type II toxin-antitoxin system RelE/ParE family toxin [Oryzicola mucosus]|uniref:Type II toxin-antitoxin system RelE/ParE family toxin n=1 Tax=Oryzicola mucosus TaxID=2767425 RepID=A0A8J6U1K3_9HYPH|nr:type II toxin-antitoxin system RelE/ParE family toxin [Oryzicola mucosus]MBD0414553.1 type II toxin-antitoxin system RelE/ParE family toxin [Oryzicola mucosus]